MYFVLTLLFAGGILIASVVINILIASKRSAILSYCIGLLPIVAYGLLLLMPLFGCRNDDYALACEWTGVGIVIYSGLTLAMIAVYTLIAIGIAVAHPTRTTPEAGQVISGYSKSRSVGTVLLLLMMGIGGAWTAKLLYYDLGGTGIFVTWRNLGTPPPSYFRPLPGEKAVKIESYNLRSILIRTNEDRTFDTELQPCPSLGAILTSGNCWTYGGSYHIEEAPKADPECRIDFWIWNPPGQVVERVEASSCFGEHMIQTDYVLLVDGSVWSWHHEKDMDASLSLPPVLVGGALAGMLLGIVLIRWFNKKPSKNN